MSKELATASEMGLWRRIHKALKGRTRLMLEEILERVRRIEIMDQETKDLLDKIDADTTQIAEDLTTQAAAQSEIAADLKTLAAGPLPDPAIKFRLQAHAKALDAAAATTKAQASLLAQMGADYAPPAPPPAPPAPPADVPPTT